MIHYILQVIFFQVLFLAIYDLFLSKETFFTKNRWYLVSTPILSFIIPLIKIPTFQKAVSQEYIVQLPAIFLSPEKVIQRTFEATTFYESVNYITILFWVGVVVFLILFLIKLMKIINLIKMNKAEKLSIFKLIFIPNNTNAFSFFNYIFLGKEIPVSQQEKIIQHEMVHSKQKHSIDLLLFEFLKIIMWFNPMIYFYQKRITLVHEYISDEIVSKKEAKEAYINNLLSNYFQVENVAFINQFYKKSLIKKRIIMMTKNKSKKMNQLKYLLLIPVLASMLFYTSCISNESQDDFLINEELKEVSLTEVVVSKESSISFLKVDKAPTFSDCESGDKDCFSKNIQKHFSENFDADLPKTLGLSSGRKRIFISFKIDKEGNVADLKVRAPHPAIKQEVLSVMNLLPKVIPGEHKGKTIGVKYSIPLTIVVGGSHEDDTSNSLIKDFLKDDAAVSFMNMDKVPTFPGCESGDKDCFSKSVQKHFSRNFDADMPKNLGLEPGRKRIFIGFKIDENGQVIDVQARAPHPKIKSEVMKVMNSLPKMIPGENDGKAVTVNYSIPFTLLIE